MTGQTSTGTRERILAAARDLFATYGYQRTSLRQIAERLGITKAAVLYHFPSKDLILAALTEPMLCDLESVLEQAAQLDPERARWAAVEGLLDAFLAHRKTLQMAWHDLAFMTNRPEVYQRFLRWARQACDVVAGPGAGLADQVRALQVLAALGDPAMYFPDVPDAELRAVVLDGVLRLLGEKRPQPAVNGNGDVRRGAARPGRPRALDGDRLALARRMYEAGGHSVTQIAETLGVSRATLYRYLGGGQRLKTKN